MTWKPILDGELAERADEAIRRIAVALAPATSVVAAPTLALWWAYAADRIAGTDTAYDAATTALLERIATDGGSIALHGGLAGAAFTLAHITDHAADEILDAFDRRFAALIPALDEVELAGGLAGLAIYLLERPDSAIARTALAALVDRLGALAVTTGAGIAWERYDCGVPHGVPGVLVALGRIAAVPAAPPLAGVLCERATRWLRSHRSDDPLARFPTRVEGGRAIGRPPSAWCYGDPGIAVAGWNTAVCTGVPIDEWHALALEIAARSDADARVEGAGLCHGAIGLAHLFNRCFQASGDPRLRDAARRWFATGLAMPHDVSADLIIGAPGIGLALLAATSAVEPAWDRLLGCDIPPV